MQLNFFRKGLKSLEAVDTHVKLIAERQHIDYQFSGLENNEGEDGEDSYDANEEGELSFDYRDNKQGLDVVSTSRNSMDVRIYCTEKFYFVQLENGCCGLVILFCDKVLLHIIIFQF